MCVYADVSDLFWERWLHMIPHSSEGNKLLSAEVRWETTYQFLCTYTFYSICGGTSPVAEEEIACTPLCNVCVTWVGAEKGQFMA